MTTLQRCSWYIAVVYDTESFYRSLLTQLVVLPQTASLPACFAPSSPTACPYASFAAPAATVAAPDAYDDAVEPPFDDGALVAFAQPSSTNARMGQRPCGDGWSEARHAPLFEFSLSGSMFADSMMPGRPSTTPAVWLKLRAASRSPAKLGPAPAPLVAEVGSVTYEYELVNVRARVVGCCGGRTKLDARGSVWVEEAVGLATPG